MEYFINYLDCYTVAGGSSGWWLILQPSGSAFTRYVNLVYLVPFGVTRDDKSLSRVLWIKICMKIAT